MAKKSMHKWDSYVREAHVEPFVLEVDENKTISVENPTGVQTLRISQGLRAGDAEVILMGLTGDAYQEVRNLLGGAGHKAMASLIEDLMEHFGFYEEVTFIGPGGGEVKASRPTEIQRLIQMGYAPKGEARASQL